MVKTQPVPVLVAHLPWMVRYDGTDKIVAGFKKYAEGQGNAALWHERRSFEHCTDRKVKASPFHFSWSADDYSTLSLHRLGANADSKSVRGVLAIFTATHIDGRGRVIVGWMINATVFKNVQNWLDRKFLIEAKTQDTILLPTQDRKYQVPSFVANRPGRSTLFYASDVDAAYASTLQQYIATYKPAPGGKSTSNKKTAGGGSRGPSNLAVEAAAMELALSELEEFYGRPFQDVSAENHGWDIESIGRPKIPDILVEVKGLSSKALKVELTPNEYAAALRHGRGADKRQWVLFVVTETLSTEPASHLFVRTNNGWVDQSSGETLKVKEKTAAIMSL